MYDIKRAQKLLQNINYKLRKVCILLTIDIFELLQLGMTMRWVGDWWHIPYPVLAQLFTSFPTPLSIVGKKFLLFHVLSGGSIPDEAPTVIFTCNFLSDPSYVKILFQVGYWMKCQIA